VGLFSLLIFSRGGLVLFYKKHFGSGSQIGSGNYVVYKSGGSNSVTATGLTPNTTYSVAVYEFNGSNGTENYLTTSPATGNQATLPLANLVVAKSDAPDPAIAGQNITYTLNISNRGPDSAQTVFLTDTFPVSTTLVSAQVTGGSGWIIAAPAMGGTGNVVFGKGAMSSSETAAFQIVVKVNSSTADGTIIQNSATASTATNESNYSDNTASVTTTVLKIGITASPNPVAESSPVTFSGSFTHPTQTIHWDFGDGFTASGMLTPTHTYGDDGLFTVTLVITDTLGIVGNTSLQIVVDNVAPMVNAGTDGAAQTGAPFAFKGSFTDPGWLDTHTILWDFGDGSQASSTLAPNHTFTEAGTYIVTLSVTDGDGGVGVDTVKVTVSESDSSHRVYLPLIFR
jgi:uncharacterized repeat protein (TIGR01451 family)